MAVDKNITQLTADTSPALTDILYGVKNPGGSPLDRKLTWTTVLGVIVKKVNLATGFTLAGGTTEKTLTVPLDATVSGTNTGDQTITLTGDVTGSGTSSFATTIGANKVTLAMMATMATASLLGRSTAGTGNVEVLSAATVKTLLSLNNVENTALSTWAGSANITTLGTIATGTWSATTIAVNKGGTGQTTYTDGQLLIGNSSGNTLSKATLTAGTNISVTNGNGTITIAATGEASFAWSEVTGTSQQAVNNAGYLTNNAGLVTVTLPTTAALGTRIRVAGSGAGGWKIAQNAGQSIKFLSTGTTAGVTGYLASTVRYDSVELICITVDTVWSVIGSVGNITVN